MVGRIQQRTDRWSIREVVSLSANRARDEEERRRESVMVRKREPGGRFDQKGTGELGGRSDEGGETPFGREEVCRELVVEADSEKWTTHSSAARQN